MGKDAYVGVGALRKGKLKKQARIEALRKEKERIARLRDAAGKRDLLDEYAAFRHYARNGMVANLSSVMGSELSDEDADSCIALQRANLDGVEGEGWDEGSARAALKHEESRLLLLHGGLEPMPATPSPTQADEWVLVDSDDHAEPDEDSKSPMQPTETAFLGYLHLQFCLREAESPASLPLLCVLNMQLVQSAMGKGLGKFALQLCELISRRNGLELVMLYMQDGEVKTVSLNKQKPSLEAPMSSPRAPTGAPVARNAVESVLPPPGDDEGDDDGDDDDFEIISRPFSAHLAPSLPLAIRC